ncbi:TIGR03757 family integrating conjugative element protein [Aromatoleum petrolei]|uniref:TIGR03757 family integrating conjugative element protein n=1 Tax=Aromatoleum petrolei TaxID=76116 RepID=A0ABX1MTX0_9RHOO|nr:TIGR03757 family integrating conjugative element protein [Aromatoleum petrolei]NMF91429.1 TIGR03757 family integrating conjugative element protein [Aromatoleum petrolei]QTQ34954.1 Integrating conjugative element protein, PFL4709-type [Aromatoleum petrolei]
MSATLRQLVASLACTAALPPVQAQERVEVFLLGTQHVRGTGTATVYHVDGMERINAALSAGLPPDPAHAEAIAKRRFEALTEADRQAIGTSAQGLAAAMQYRLTKVPAIVFDGAAVVYGVGDVNQARAIYQTWLARRGR